MFGRLKHAADSLASSTGASATSPIPTPSVAPTFAPGKKGPAGLAPRTNYSRVNTGEPPAPDAGAAAQKSLPPRGAEMKLAGGEGLMGKMTGRSTLQDLVKGAMVKSAERVRISDEARLQEDKLTGVKTASEKVIVTTKVASAQQVEKLASALDFLASEFDKEGSTAATAPPPGVSASNVSAHPVRNRGEGVHTVPMHPGVQKAMPHEQSPTQMENTIDHATGGVTVQKNASKSVLQLIREKQASEDEKTEEKETEGLEEAKKGLEKTEKAHASESKKASALVEYMLGRTKKAEDAINPAHISAGAAVAPDTSMAGEAGGQPAGGAPMGPTGLVASNEAAMNYTKGQSHGIRREELKKYLNEPALSATHDPVLREAFEHTPQAGTKFSSAAPAASVKTAAARALLMNMAKSAEAEAKKNNGAAA